MRRLFVVVVAAVALTTQGSAAAYKPPKLPPRYPFKVTVTGSFTTSWSYTERSQSRGCTTSVNGEGMWKLVTHQKRPGGALVWIDSYWHDLRIDDAPGMMPATATRTWTGRLVSTGCRGEQTVFPTSGCGTRTFRDSWNTIMGLGKRAEATGPITTLWNFSRALSKKNAQIYIGIQANPTSNFSPLTLDYTATLKTCPAPPFVRLAVFNEHYPSVEIPVAFGIARGIAMPFPTKKAFDLRVKRFTIPYTYSATWNYPPANQPSPEVSVQRSGTITSEISGKVTFVRVPRALGVQGPRAK